MMSNETTDPAGNMVVTVGRMREFVGSDLSCAGLLEAIQAAIVKMSELWNTSLYSPYPPPESLGGVREVQTLVFQSSQ